MDHPSSKFCLAMNGDAENNIAHDCVQQANNTHAHTHTHSWVYTHLGGPYFTQ